MSGREISTISGRALARYLPVTQAGFGIPMPHSGRLLNLGTVLPMTSAEALRHLVERRRAEMLAASNNAAPDEAERIKKRAPISFTAFQRVVKRDVYESFTEGHFYQNIFIRDRHPPTLQGYASYLCDLDPELADIITTPLQLPLPAADLRRHSYIVGASGAGKSELLKLLIHEQIAARDAAVVVVDAHSDMCEQIARWPEVARDGRLTFIAPMLLGDYVPTINPLEPPKGADDRTKEKISNRLAEVIGDICRGEGSGATVRMVSLAKAAVRVLLDVPGSTLQDFYKMLGEEPPKALIEAGRNHSDEVVQWFFRNDWMGKDYMAAKNAIRARLLQLLLHKDFLAMTCAPSTVPLYDLVDQGKIILFSLGRAGTDSARVIGKLVVSLLAALGDIRKESDRLDRKPVHIVLDECQNFIGPATRTILEELRKYGLHLTLANQFVKQLPLDDRETVLANTHVKILGRSDYAPTMLSTMGLDNDEGREAARKLTGGVFLVKWGTAPPFMLTARSDLADDSRQISKSQWIALQTSQRAFYRRPGAIAPPSPEKLLLEAPKGLSRDLD